MLPGMAWPAAVGRNAALKLALLFQIEQEQWRTTEEIESSQFVQLRQLAAFAAETVPYYQRQLGKAFAANELNPDSWRELPVLKRKALHDAGPDMKSIRVPREHGVPFKISTSGSTGMVVEVLGTDLTDLFWQVICLRDHQWHRRDLGAKLCSIRYQRDSTLKGPEGASSTGWGPATDDVAVTGPCVSYDILLDVAHLVERLVLDRPAYLLSHPSLVAGLAAYCVERGIRLPGLREVRTLGESDDETLRSLCGKAWGVPIVDMYTCQEAGYLALQCPEQQHYHVQSENVLLEVVDEQGRRCAPGEVGRVLITSLNNFATPLIRYEIGDYAEVGEACSCGRGLPVLKRIMGRYRNLLMLPDGTRRWPRLGYQGGLRDIAPIDLMQMIQCDQTHIDVRLVMPRRLSAAEQENLTGFIRKNLGYPFSLRFEYVDGIRNPANGKAEQFISRLGPAPS